MQGNIWVVELERMRKLFNWIDPISVEVLYSMVQDNKYAEMVLMLRNTPEKLGYMLASPTRNRLDICVKEAKGRMEGILAHYEKILPILERHEKQIERYQENLREVYLDNNSTTKIRSEVELLMTEYVQGCYGYGNPSTITSQGGTAANMLQAARIRIAKVIHAESGEIYFTGSGTEANNLAIKGIAFEHMQQKGHIVTTMVEHPSVLESMKYLEKLGFRITYLKPDHYGAIKPSSVYGALQKDTILVSIMAANNEIGTLYPIHEIGLLCKDKRIPFMVDGIQAFGKMPINVREMNVTLFTFSGHKIYGPKGVGGIYIRSGTILTPLLHGGGQEKGIRSGTENVGHIIALGLAAELADKEMGEENKRLKRLRGLLLDGLKKIEPNIIVYGSTENKFNGLLSVGFRGFHSNLLVRELNRIGISVSSGSACNSIKTAPSHVMKAIEADTQKVAVIRFGLGRFSEEADIRYLLKYFADVLMISKIFI